jgi:type III pantothenate kinase
MILAFDVGNTSTTLGVLGGEGIVTARVRTDPRTTDELGVLLVQLLRNRGVEPEVLRGAICATVVPSMRYAIEQACRRYLGLQCLHVGPGLKTGLKLRVANSREVGADRIVNAVAALARYGGPAIVVAFGTATTVDAVNGAGEFVGGVIAPGFRTAGDALFENAAQLPRVEVARPKGGVIGRDTVHALQSGLWNGTLGMVDHLVRQVRDELGGRARVVATGPYSELFGPASSEIDEVQRFLTLEGLGLIYERNQR